MTYLLIWWGLLLALGFAALPITMRFLRFLPDRGYAFAKPLALLIWVYPFWLLTIFGFTQNSVGALAFLLGLLALVSWGLWRGKGENSVFAWLRAHWKYALVAEIVFGVAFLAFAYYRAFNPEISATEKPMEFMFLNSILQSDAFPPRDAWLSGYAISYYYLGYVIVAALAKLGSVPSEYAFNLGLTMTYALVAVGAFGLIFNLVTHAQKTNDAPKKFSLAPYLFGILAVLLLLVIGNLQGLVEVGYNAGIGSREFYASLNLHSIEEVTPAHELVDASAPVWAKYIPQDNWWWWRASRVLNDVGPVGGGHVEVIDEFPAFSFLLGDLHPHVLALPFGVLALAIALNTLLRGQHSPQAGQAQGVAPTELPNYPTTEPSISNPQSPVSTLQVLQHQFLTLRMLLTALVVGALGMLNTWDIVTYGVVIVAAYVIVQYRDAQKFSRTVLISSVLYLLILYVVGYLLFLPFYLGFASQARGIAPNIFNRTPLHQYLIMWGMFVFAVASFVIALLLQARDRRRVLSEWFSFALPLLVVPIVIALIGVLVLAVSPSLRDLLASALQVNSENATPSVLSAFAASFVASPGAFILLVILIAGIAALGRLELMNFASGDSRTAIVFALLLAFIGFMLTFGVEFLYVLDTFGTRMNTVFKLYYQAWLLLAMAAAFGAFYIWHTTRGIGRAAWLTAFCILFASSLIYPALAYPNRANYFDAKRTAPTLDGWAWVERTFPDDYAAIEWVRANVPRNAVILEAAGDQYSFDNRVSVATGIPTVVGWGGHELQWRGTSDVYGPREQDVKQIYRSRSISETRELLKKYGVDFVIVGGIERNKYDLNQALVDKFGKIGELVFEQGSMRIYRVGEANVSLRAP